jgi:cell shape-determining protein MreD
MRGPVALFLTLYLLRAAVAEVNSALSGMHVWLFAGGLFVAYSALAMPFRDGFFVSVLAGLLCDAVTPVRFGTHAVLFAAAHAVVYNARERLQRDDTTVRVAVTLLVNAGLFLALSFTRIRLGHGGAAMWPRMLSDLFWSELVVAVIAPWFFALQLRTLELAGANPSRST